MRKINLIAGLLLLLVFLATGYYMEVWFRPAHLTELAMRMEVRANHLYILFIALLNMLAFTSSSLHEKKWQKYTGATSGILLLLAGILAILAFIYEHDGDLQKRYMTLFSAILSITAVTGFVLNALIGSRRR